MDFELSNRAQELRDKLTAFMEEWVYPAESVYHAQLAASGDPHFEPPVMNDLKAAARQRDLWNLFLPEKSEWGGGLSNLDYAPVAEVTGRSPIAPEVFNCNSPDSGNMEILSRFGSDEQKRRWLAPLMAGEIRSVFAMTEPAVASSDATNVECRIDADGDDYVINGRKWWISGAARASAKVAIVMGKTDLEAPTHRQQSMILVPMDTPGVTVARDLLVFGYNDQEGHCEMVFTDVRVPRESLLGEEGSGFAIAQSRLGPGRIHHCMRSIGAAERALELMCRRAHARSAFGGPLAEKGVIREWIADSRIEIDQARLLTLHAAWLMDRYDNRVARGQIAAIKIAVPAMACRVVDRAIQLHGGGGLSQDFPLAGMYAWQRALRILDGPDEVHRHMLGRLELGKYAPPREQPVR
ncbi:acyl-CoA dehydrogenase family protein [Conexibacter sp. DBS9H8]|uniref:acyl-CoA dehydrogenase family protein n=1 Tax=Conexibacter sp. DBS9H8 TaxID=2937801 RepID=UPI00200E88C1|nr:acyl-CoA dehydrogenase family protein [Conexibacter sp. DBS9H8]